MRIQIGPEAKIVIAEIENVRCAGSQRHHRFGDRDVIGVGTGQLEKSRNSILGIVDHVHLGCDATLLELGPIGCRRAGTHQCGIHKPQVFAGVARLSGRQFAQQRRY
jgi:hypothetical protein